VDLGSLVAQSVLEVRGAKTDGFDLTSRMETWTWIIVQEPIRIFFLFLLWTRLNVVPFLSSSKFCWWVIFCLSKKFTLLPAPIYYVHITLQEKFRLTLLRQTTYFTPI
jgi:hypothetical protein